MNLIKYGIIGYGRYAEKRLQPAFEKSEYAKLIGITKRNLEEAEQKAKKHDIPFFYDDPLKLVKNPEINAVIITSPPAFHKEHVSIAAEAGKHVLVEKPMALNQVEAKEMVEVCYQHKVKLMSAFVMRFIDAIGKMRDIVYEGKIGDIEFANGHFSLDASLSVRSWLSDPQISGGGPVADIGSHILDLMQYVMGKSVIHLKSFVHPNFSEESIERKAFVALEFEDHTLGSLQVSFDMYRESALTFYGIQGKLQIVNFNKPDETVVIELVVDDKVENIEVANGNYYLKMLNHFSQALLFDKSILTPGETGVQNQILIDQIYGK